VAGDIEQEKQIAAEAAVELVETGMRVGLGSGSTVGYFLPALARRGLDIRCVATSEATEEEARDLGLTVISFDDCDRLDIAIDGADQVNDEHWLIKGGGGAHTREKIVAAAAERFVVIVSSDKLVDRLHAPVPLELLPFGLPATLRALELGPGTAVVRPSTPPSPDGGIIADWMGEPAGYGIGDESKPRRGRGWLRGELDEPLHVAAYLANVAGVVDHGLFPPSMVDDVLVGRGHWVQHRHY
jgi:ribose 5-phosphate isomerase A